VREPDQVRRILEDFDLNGVEVNLSEDGTGTTIELSAESDEPDAWERPTAIHRRDWLDESKYPDEEKLREAEDELRLKKGVEGFIELLQVLSPYLETPLLVLLVSRGIGDCSGEVWYVHPGAQEVTVLEASC